MSAPQVLSAEATSSTEVVVTFDQDILVSSGYLRPASYFIDGGLFAVGVADNPGDPGKSVVLTTTGQLGGRIYKLTCSAALRADAGPNDYLDVAHASATFEGIAAPGDYVVANLRARSHPAGRRVELFWDDPTSPTVTHCRILRRQRAWQFEDGDPGDVIYDGAPLSATAGLPRFVDMGLFEQTWYYYTVLVSSTGGPPYTATAASRTLGLSTTGQETLDTAGILKQRVIPRTYLERDQEPPGLGTLEKYLTLIGGAADLLRAVLASALLVADWEETPYPFLTPVARSVGFEPEGEAYDFDTTRRVLLQLGSLLRSRGRLGTATAGRPGTGVLGAVYALVQWLVTAEEFGVEGRRLFGTADLVDGATETHTVAASVASAVGSITDPARAWSTDLWAGGRLLDGLGNWLDVASSTGTVATFATFPAAPSPWRTTLAAAATAGTRTATVASTARLQVGQRIQLWDAVGAVAETVEITSLNSATGVLTFWTVLQNSYAAASTVVSWDLTKPTVLWEGVVDAASALNSLVVNQAPPWAFGRWIGLKFKDAGGVVHTCTASSVTTITFTDGWTPSATDHFTVAAAFSGTTAQLVYTLENGYFPRLYDPRFDLALRGSRLDPFHYFYGGGGAGSLGGQFGAGDLGLFLLDSTIPIALGRTTSVSGNVLTDTGANYATDALAGAWLNPNQNGSRFVQIVSNSGTAITAAEDISDIAQNPQAYVVLSERNKHRYERLLARLPEFLPLGMRPRILFV